MRAVLAQQHLGAVQLAVVVVAHSRAVGTSIMDVKDIPDVDLGQHPVNGKLVVILAQPAHHVVLVVAGLVLLAQHSDVVVSAVHGGAHQVCGASVQTNVLLINVLFVDDGGHQCTVGAGGKAAHLAEDGHIAHTGRHKDLLKLFAHALADGHDVVLGLLRAVRDADAAGQVDVPYKRLFIPNPFSSDEENEAKKSAQQQEEDAGNAIKDFMTGVWDSLAGTVMGLLTLVVDLGTLYVDVRWKSVVPIQVPEVLDQEVEKIKQKYEPRLKDPVNTIGGIGQSICDTADEKGVAYSS